MTGRLIVVSNRVPTEGLPSGGLVVALHYVLRAEGGLWIGTHDAQDDATLTQTNEASLERLKGPDGYETGGCL